MFSSFNKQLFLQRQCNLSALLCLVFILLFVSVTSFAANRIYDHANAEDVKDFISDVANGVINPDSTMSDGVTALMLVAGQGDIENVDLLLSKGADLNKIANDSVTTALVCAHIKGHQKVAALLRTKGAVISQSQAMIIFNLRSYLDKYFPEDVKLNEIFKAEAGYCHGLTALWLYSKWIGSQSSGNHGYTNWFKITARTICEWDGKKKLTNKEVDDFKKFISLILYFQSENGQINFEKCMSLSQLDTRGKTLKKKYSIVSAFSLIQLLNLLENIVYNDQLIRVFYRGHVAGLFKHREKYYYYDANNFYGEIREISLDKIAEIIFDTNRSIGGVDSEIAFVIDDFNDIFYAYPNQRMFLTKIDKSDNSSGLIEAAKRGCFDSLMFFLEQRVDPDKADYKGWTALMYACKYGHIEMVNELLKHKADPNKVNNENTTALMYACQNGYSEIVKKLLDYNADPNKTNYEDSTALMCASQNGYFEIVKELLVFKADPNRARNDGATALMFASQDCYVETVKILLKKGADPSKKNSRGHKAINLAVYNGCKECAAILGGYENIEL